MFKVVEKRTNGDATTKRKYKLDDVKNIYDLILNITKGDLTEAKHALMIAANMSYEDEFYSGMYDYYIVCYER